MNEILQQRIEAKSKELGQMFFPDNMNVFARPNWEAGYIETACKEIANFALQNQWISVEEALPEFYRNVLVIFDNLHITNAYYDGEYWWWNDGFPTGVNSYGDAIYSSQQRCEDKPTHWMPIPQIEGGGKWQ